MKRTVLILVAVVLLVALGLLVFRSGDNNAPEQTELLVSVESSLVAEEDSLYSARWKDTPPKLVQSATSEPASTNLWTRFANGDTPRVTREQLEPFLVKNQRSAEALLGALRASGDEELLKEAKERFPNDPRVQFAAAFKTAVSGERQHWLEKLKQSDPENALANYLLAGQHLKAGRVEEALQEITAASSRPRVDNYLIDFMQNTEEAYRAGGFTEAEAKVAAGTSALLPEQTWLKQAGVELVELAKRYHQAGDETSAQAVWQMGANLGRRLHQSPQISLIQESVGMAIERLALNELNSAAPPDESRQVVWDQLDGLAARRKAQKELISQTESTLRTMSDEDLAHYFDRAKLYGEAAALRWVLNHIPQL